MLTLAHILNFLLMILLPILVGIWVVRKFGISWKLLLAGALTFIASQLLHIPLVSAMAPLFTDWPLIGVASVLGLLAGIFEETARWILYRFILKKSRTWEEGVVVGVGHGGIEALLLGLAAALAFFQFLGYRGVDLSTLPQIPADQAEAISRAVSQYWSLAPYAALLGFVERVFAMCLHIALSVMVLYAIARNKPVWFWLALLWHAVVDAVAVFLVNKIDMFALEGIIGLLAVISLGILFYLRPRFASPQPEPVITPA